VKRAPRFTASFRHRTCTDNVRIPQNHCVELAVTAIDGDATSTSNMINDKVTP